MAGLYAALATDGLARQAHLLAQDTPPPASFLSARAAAAIADVLTQPFPTGGAAGVAWKTGTSWGGRDAWALGFDAGMVAGVWVGRPDGTPLPGATGRDLAVPLLAQMFSLLPPRPRSTAAPSAVQMQPAMAASDALRLLFPPPGAVLSADGPVTLRAMGGQRPLTFLIDGARLPTDPARREVAWQPPSSGFYRLTVLDAHGAVARAAVRVK